MKQKNVLKNFEKIELQRFLKFYKNNYAKALFKVL